MFNICCSQNLLESSRIIKSNKFYKTAQEYVFTPPSQAECHILIFEQSTTYLTWEFSFSQTGCHTKVKELSLTFYSFITGMRIVRCLSFRHVFAPWEIQTDLSRYWTWVTISISSNDNHYISRMESMLSKYWTPPSETDEKSSFIITCRI